MFMMFVYLSLGLRDASDDSKQTERVRIADSVAAAQREQPGVGPPHLIDGDVGSRESLTTAAAAAPRVCLYWPAPRCHHNHLCYDYCGCYCYQPSTQCSNDISVGGKSSVGWLPARPPACLLASVSGAISAYRFHVSAITIITATMPRGILFLSLPDNSLRPSVCRRRCCYYYCRCLRHRFVCMPCCPIALLSPQAS